MVKQLLLVNPGFGYAKVCCERFDGYGSVGLEDLGVDADTHFTNVEAVVRVQKQVFF